MSYFLDNTSSIINNLELLNKKYFISIYIETIEREISKNTHEITINYKGIGLNLNEETASTTTTITGTTNTLTGIGLFYTNLLDAGIELLYEQFSYIEGFRNCKSDNVLKIFNPLNNISLVSTNNMKFKFDILNINSDRQGGQTIDAIIEYQYVEYWDGINYINLRDYIIKVLTSNIDLETYWENLCIYIAHTSLQLFPKISGIKIDLTVKSNPDGVDPEPGDHGPTYIYGIFD